MDWIADFVALADFGSFSSAAAHRNITQPAFSRRIRMLENWLGVDLIDRRTQPVQLTPLAQRHLPEFRSLLHNMTQVRTRMRIEHNGMVRLLLTTQHSLTITRLPALLQTLAAQADLKVDFSVRSENRDECVALFMRGQADLLLCMEEEHETMLRKTPEFVRLPLGSEILVPVSAPGDGKPALHAPAQDQPLRLLAFPGDSYLGRVMEPHISRLMPSHELELLHESVFLAGVKEMARAGLGMAWLPHSLIEQELATGDLVSLAPELPTVTLELGLYRHARSMHAELAAAIMRALA